MDVRPLSAGNKYRAGRIRLFADIVAGVLDKKGRARILDVGGTRAFWDTFRGLLPAGDIEIVVGNMSDSLPNQGAYRFVKLDARSMPEFEDNSFDIVHSNSVIEHVGSWLDIERMASEVKRIAPLYFVQTPYFWFPVEPHARAAFLHWLPEQWRYRILLKRRLGYWPRADDVRSAMRTVQSAYLMDRRQYASLFPDAQIVMEHAFGLPKSMIAIRR